MKQFTNVQLCTGTSPTKILPHTGNDKCDQMTTAGDWKTNSPTIFNISTGSYARTVMK